MIELIAVFGDDLMVANCARVSLHRRHITLEASDHKLIHYLAQHNHISPFFHPQAQFLISAPIFVARQWTRSVIGTNRTVDESVELGAPPTPARLETAAINEVSRRYVDTPPEFYQFSEFRLRPKGNIKQGSGERASPQVETDCQARMAEAETDCMLAYEHMIRLGVAPEQARTVLPQTMITTWIETGSLAYWARFCGLRMAPDVQQEIREIAESIHRVMGLHFPISWAALLPQYRDR